MNGVRLWVSVGPLQFQPGEVAKICLILFLAGYLREKREVIAQGRLKDFGPLVAIWGAAMLVIVQTNDLGSALLNFGIFLAMLYVATGRALFVAAGIALFVGGATVLYNAIDHVQDRVTIWLHPWTDDKVYCALNGQLEYRQDCASYQLVKSLYSIANGGFGGTGLGEGTFTSVDGTQLIPYLRTDFIFSAIAQELGLVGAAALLLVFMVFVVRGMRVALQSQDGFSKLLAAGLDVRLRAAGVHHRRRRPARRPVDRDHAAIRLVRRDEHRGELRPARAPAPRLEPGERTAMNRQIIRLTQVALVLVGVLVVMTTYWQTWAAASLADRQDNAIRRVAEFSIDRGLIFSFEPRKRFARNRGRDVEGRTLFFRRYPYGPLTAHVVGYSTVGRSRTGLERSLERLPDRLERQPLDGPRQGIRRAAGRDRPRQQRRHDDRPRRAGGRAGTAGTNCGAVVALDPRTGKVLVMAASPSFDPNRVENDYDSISAITANCTPAAPLLNRASAGLYVPGSTFKVITASAALESKKYTPESTFVDPGYCTVYGKRVNNFDTSRPFGTVTLLDALTYSVQLGVLQHRAEARREADPRYGEALRLLRAAAARDALPTSGSRAASTATGSSSTRRSTRTSTLDGWRSGRSGCS